MNMLYTIELFWLKITTEWLYVGKMFFVYMSTYTVVEEWQIYRDWH